MINRIMLGKETVENVGWMELGKQENPEKNSKNLDSPPTTDHCQHRESNSEP